MLGIHSLRYILGDGAGSDHFRGLVKYLREQMDIDERT